VIVNFVVYDPGTGKLKRGGSCHEQDVPLQAQSGEAVLAIGTMSCNAVVNVDPSRSPPVPVPRSV
jgi:hypothetical protein